MPARNEQIRRAAADIRRYAAVIAIKRRALDPAPIADDPREPLGKIFPAPGRKFPARARPLFVFPENARLRRVLMSCVCRRSQ
jgi:hypothetical protein